MTDSTSPTQRVSIRTLRRWIRERQSFAMLTCYDATMARLLWQGGIRTMLVGDTAAQMVLGHDSTLPVSMPFMLEITAAVRRGAPQAMIVADMPFGSYHCGEDEAMRHATDFLRVALADAVKLEVDASFAPLVQRMSRAGVPVVAHLGSRPQQVRHAGGYRAAGRTRAEADAIVETAATMLEAGADMLLLEAVPDEVTQRVVALAVNRGGGIPDAPVIGCGAGHSAHGHVVVVHDILGMSEHAPSFAPGLAEVGAAITAAAGKWAKLTESGRYLKDDHPYKMSE